MISIVNILFAVCKDNDNDDDEKPQVQVNVGKGRKRDLPALEKDADGNPRIPIFSLSKPSGKTLKDTIRAFFNSSYSKL